MSDSTASPRDDMLQMVNGYELSRAIHVAAVLGVADFLMDGPRTVDDLAAATGAHAPTLHRLLRALASVGIFVEDTTGWFGLTDRAEYLRSDVSGSLRYWAMASGGRSFWASWGDLLESVRTGEAAFPRQHGMTNWEYRARLPDEGAAFDAAMTANSRAVADIIAAHYDFSKFGVVADIGGGEGVLLSAILAANPSLHGILFDQPRVLADGRDRLQVGAIAERCQVLAGDFFKSVPPGADAYLLKSVITDWDDVQAATILTKCRTAMRATGTLLLVEVVVRPPNEPDPAKFADLRMLVMNGGQARTAAEYQQLLTTVRFQLTRVMPTPSQFSILEAIPV